MTPALSSPIVRACRLSAPLGFAAFAAFALSTACSGSAQPPRPAAAPTAVAAAPPPKDDGKASQGGEGGAGHAAALEQLRTARPSWRIDSKKAVSIPLPDGQNWTRVTFWSVKTLVGFRYGKDHQAVVAGFVLPVDDAAVPGACGKAFEKWTQPYVDSFEVELQHDAPQAVDWNGKIVDIDSLVARTATLGDRDEYAAVYATYPMWPKACLIVGMAVPARNELERAKAVRDRFTKDVLPKIKIFAKDAPSED